MSTLNFDLLNPYLYAAKEAGHAFDLDPDLILAIIYKESTCTFTSIRFESGYFSNKEKRTFFVSHFALLNHISDDTESALQCFSFGPMQVMGVMTRRLGYTGPLTSLLSIDLGVYWGVKLLASQHSLSVEDAIATYNHGSPEKDSSGLYIVQSYVDDVMSYLKLIKGPS